MDRQEGRNVIFAAAKSTAQTITRREWWRPAFIVGSILFVASAALPVFLLLRLGVWRGITYELSPFNDGSLARLLIPILAVLVVGFATAVLVQLVMEIVREARGRRRGLEQ